VFVIVFFVPSLCGMMIPNDLHCNIWDGDEPTVRWEIPGLERFETMGKSWNSIVEIPASQV